ncbi:MAG: MgtC/SapB family protein [Gammaproteobacteria bacterium]|nr:MgtC/SapB family protein [Gammaproteobacteria bacterium]
MKLLEVEKVAMPVDYELIVSRLMLALLAGGLIGLERALHGREAGFRTHTLVCVSSSLLMLLMAYQWHLVPEEYLQTVRTDPTRMAQGIMTGIGFLGAGVIIKEGLTVRGLTTAASIWMTSAIGIVIGLGFYFPALVATILTILILSTFRWVEAKIPSMKYARLSIRFIRSEKYTDEDTLRKLIESHNIKSFEAGYRLDEQGARFQYVMTICSKEQSNFRQLAQSLVEMEDVHEFQLIPSS